MHVRPIILLVISVISFDLWASPQIQHWTLANGARAYFVQSHQLPMVQFSVGFDAGSARDPDSLRGLARFVSAMLEEGVSGLNGTEIATQFETVGAEFSSGNGRDMSVLELRSLSDEPLLSSAVDVFTRVIQQPTFPAAAMARVRNRILTGLKRQQQSPGSVVSRAFYDNLFKDHPYANPPSGEPQDVTRITRDDLIDFHGKYFVGANAVIAMVGDMNAGQARRWADAIVGRLPPGVIPPKLDVVPLLPNQARVLNVPFASTQTHLMMGQVGMKQSDPDYFPLYIGNYTLGGGGLVSRLSKELREKRGLTYSANSYFIPMQQNGPFVINLQTRNDQGPLAERLAIETVTEFVKNGPTQKELDAAKKSITGSFPLRFDSNAKIAGSLLNIAFYDLPLDYMSTFPDKINAVTLQQVRETFQRRIFPHRLLRVVLGGG